jgi:hypothetical protein
MKFHSRNDDVHSLLLYQVGIFKHLIGFADSRGHRYRHAALLARLHEVWRETTQVMDDRRSGSLTNWALDSGLGSLTSFSVTWKFEDQRPKSKDQLFILHGNRSVQVEIQLQHVSRTE